MRRTSGQTLWLVFSSAVLLLVTIAVGADLITARYASSEDWVSHTQQVATWLIRLRSDLASAEASRLAFVSSQDPVELPLYDESARQIPVDLATLERLTTDNLVQQQRIARLRPLVAQRLGLLGESIDLAKGNATSAQAQQQKLTLSGTALTREVRGLLDQMQNDEASLLRERETISDDTYKWERGVLGLAFLLTISILAATFWTLLVELKERRQAEEVVRRLSGRLLKVQDEERRRIARELHDSLGQLLTSLKMNLDNIASRPPGAAAQKDMIEGCVELAQQSINETRTLSYLLHPPLLDEFGFASAAKWYVDGFVQRSKIDVKFQIADNFERMPDEIELVLFRVLQESLTNILRHSGSSTAEIAAQKTPHAVTLEIVDHGRGIPADALAKFRRTRGGMGVGLAGMRERVEELGGSLDIRSAGHNTVLLVSIPLPGEKQSGERSSFSSPLTQEIQPKERASSALAGGSRTTGLQSPTVES